MASNKARRYIKQAVYHMAWAEDQLAEYLKLVADSDKPISDDLINISDGIIALKNQAYTLRNQKGLTMGKLTAWLVVKYGAAVCFGLYSQSWLIGLGVAFLITWDTHIRKLSR